MLIWDESLDFLQTYVQVHFASKELCMFRSVCAVATQNKLAHHGFLQRVEELTLNPEKGPTAELPEAPSHSDMVTSSPTVFGPQLEGDLGLTPIQG